MVLWTARQLRWFCVNRIPTLSAGQNYCCGWVPCFLVSRPFRSLDEFFFCSIYEVTRYQLERFTRGNNVLTLDNEYISLFVRIGWSLPEVYISLFVQIGSFCPNKVLTPVYEWICTLQLILSSAMRMYPEITNTRCKFNSIMMNNGLL